MKILQMFSTVVVADCQRFFNLMPLKSKINIKTVKFMLRFSASKTLFVYFCIRSGSNCSSGSSSSKTYRL